MERRVFGRSEPVVLVVKLDDPEGIDEYEGRRISELLVDADVLCVVVFEATATAEANGAANVFFILENSDDTRV